SHVPDALPTDRPDADVCEGWDAEGEGAARSGRASHTGHGGSAVPAALHSAAGVFGAPAVRSTAAALPTPAPSTLSTADVLPRGTALPSPCSPHVPDVLPDPHQRETQMLRSGSSESPQRRQMTHELAVIERLELAEFFLCVHDIVAAARRMGIRISGRGSAAN